MATAKPKLVKAKAPSIVKPRSVAKVIAQPDVSTASVAASVPSVSSSILFSQYLRTQGKHVDPLSDLGLKMQAQYIAEVGQHPLDILRDVASNIFAKPGERVQAAKALLEYSLRKVPAQMEVTGKDGAPLAVHPTQLKNLNDKELDTLRALLVKAQGA